MCRRSPCGPKGLQGSYKDHAMIACQLRIQAAAFRGMPLFSFQSFKTCNGGVFQSRATAIPKELEINEQIRDKEVRVIGEEGQQLGVMSPKDAMKLAREAEVDLVKIAPSAKPPVCKVMIMVSIVMSRPVKEKDAKKKQKTVELKEIRLSPNIEANDLNTKMNAAKKFLAKGNKVKITLRFRGREMAHMNASKHILDDIAENLSDVAVVEKAPKVEGRSIGMVLAEKR